MSVNVSTRQLRDAGFVEDVAATLRATGLDPSRLELEITGSMAMTRVPKERSTLRALRKLGVRLAIDDFGTGYSSLGRLGRLAIDRLKIDRSFVAGLEHKAGSRAIGRTVATLAHDLGLAVTAEGVETAGQAAHLRGLGVT